MYTKEFNQLLAAFLGVRCACGNPTRDGRPGNYCVPCYLEAGLKEPWRSVTPEKVYSELMGLPLTYDT